MHTQGLGAGGRAVQGAGRGIDATPGGIEGSRKAEEGEEWCPTPLPRHYRVRAFRVMTRGRSRMRQFRSYRSVRGVSGNWHSYRDPVARLLSLPCNSFPQQRGRVGSNIDFCVKELLRFPSEVPKKVLSCAISWRYNSLSEERCEVLPHYPQARNLSNRAHLNPCRARGAQVRRHPSRSQRQGA